MFVNELYEGSAKQVKVLYPGRFNPFHKGHAQVYQYLCQKFGKDNVYIVTSDKVELPKSPFNFAEKKQMMLLTGISGDKIVMDSQPYRAQELVAQFDPKSTILLFAVSEKDMAEDPRFQFKPKKDGSPSYFQQFTNLQSCQTLDKHGYMMTVPTFDFTVLGKQANSASQIRAQFAEADLATQRKIVTDLFGKFNNNVFNIMKARLEGQEVAEGLSTKPAKKGSQRWLTAQKRKEYEKKHPPIEPADQMYGTAKILPKPVNELSPATHAAHAAKRAPQIIPTLMKDIKKGAKMGRAVGMSMAKVKAAKAEEPNVFTEAKFGKEFKDAQAGKLKQPSDEIKPLKTLSPAQLLKKKLAANKKALRGFKKKPPQQDNIFATEDNTLLDKKTLSPKALADLHKVPTKEIIEQLKKGIKIEQEHTSDKKVATEIALDHLKEDPRYYDKLAKVEESKVVEGLYGVPVEYGPTAADTKRYEVRANSPEEACRIAVAKFRKAFPKANPYASSESVVQLDEGVSEQNLDNPDPKISSLAKAAVKMKKQLANLTGQITESTNEAPSDDILYELTSSYNSIMNSDAYSPGGKATIRFLYYHLRSSLTADNMEEFSKAWDYGLRKHPDAMAELCDTVAPLYVGDEITEGWVKKTAAGLATAAALAGCTPADQISPTCQKLQARMDGTPVQRAATIANPTTRNMVAGCNVRAKALGLDKRKKTEETIVPGFGELSPEQVKKEVAGLTAEMLGYAREGNMRAVAEYMKKLEPFVAVAKAEITESFDKAIRTVRRNAI